jgi:hypothetical protein
MKNNYRLTVHVVDQPKVDTRAPKVAPQKKGVQKTAVDMAREQAAKDRNYQKSDTPTTKENNKGRYKVFNTLSSYHKTKEACKQKLSEIRSQYEIAIGKDINKPDKFDQELWQISWVN